MKRKFALALLGIMLSMPTITNAVIIDAGVVFDGPHSIDFSIEIADTYVWQEGMNSTVTTGMPLTFLSLVIDSVDYLPTIDLVNPTLLLTEGADTATVFGDSSQDTWFLAVTTTLGSLSLGPDALTVTTTDTTTTYASTQNYLRVRQPPPVNNVPEPGMLGLLAIGLIGIGFARRRQAR